MYVLRMYVCMYVCTYVCVCHLKKSPKNREKFSAPRVVYRRTIKRIVEKYGITDSVLERNKERKFILFLDDAWLPLITNLRSQNKR